MGTNGITVEAEGVDEVVFDQLLKDLESFLVRTIKEMKELAGRLAQCSHVQIERAKKVLKRVGGWQKDHIERLVLMGRGEMAEHLAAPEQSIRASTFKLLPATAKQALNDPKQIFEVYIGTGRVLRKTVPQMTALQIRALVDIKKGILTPRQQKNRQPPARLKLQKPPKEDNIEALDRLYRKDADNVYVCGEHGASVECDGFRLKRTLEKMGL